MTTYKDMNVDRVLFRARLYEYASDIKIHNVTIQPMITGDTVSRNTDLVYTIAICKRLCVNTDRAEDIIFTLLGGVFDHEEIARFNLYLAYREELVLPSPTAFVTAGC